MRPDSSPWRVSDAVAYDLAVRAADEAVAIDDRPFADGIPSRDVGSSIESRVEVLGTDGFDRAAVGSLARPEGDPGVVRAVLADAGEVLRSRILPTIFAGSRPAENPRFLLLVGQVGSGRSRAIARLAAPERDALPVISSDLLHAFAGATSNAQPASTVQSWLLACIRHARENRFPLLLDGSFPDADAVSGILAAFEREGFVTQVAVVAASRAESLLAVASAYATERQAGRRANLPRLAEHDAEWTATRSGLDAIGEREPAVNTVIFDRAGSVVFDAEAGEGALRAFDRAVGSPMSTLRAVQWLSELKRVSEFARILPTRDAELTRYLVAAHETAIGEVIPRLRVPAGSTVARALENRLASELVSLRRTHTATPAASPVPTPSVERDGPSR